MEQELKEITTNSKIKLTYYFSGNEISDNPENHYLLGFRNDRMVLQEGLNIVDKHLNVLKKLNQVSENQGIKEVIVRMDTNGKKFIFLNGKKLEMIPELPSSVVKRLRNEQNIHKIRKIEYNPQKLITHAEQAKICVDKKSTSLPLKSLNGKPPPKIKIVNITTVKNSAGICTSADMKARQRVNAVLESANLKSREKFTLYKMKPKPMKICQGTVMKRESPVINSNIKRAETIRNTKGSSFINLKIASPDMANQKQLPKITKVGSDVLNNCKCQKTELSSKTTDTDDLCESGSKVEENKSVVDSSSQTEEQTIDDSIIDPMFLDYLNSESDLIIGKNVNMGSGPMLISSAPISSNLSTNPKQGDTNKLQFFLDLKCCVQLDSGNLPIHKGVLQGDLNLVKRQCVVLTARGCGVNLFNSNHYTPLQLAVMHNVNQMIITTLLNYKADMSLLDPDGNNVLHLAVQNNRKDLLDLFLKNMETSHLEIDQFNYDGDPCPNFKSINLYKYMSQNAWFSMYRGGPVYIIRISPANSKNKGLTPLMLCCSGNRQEMAHLLLLNGALSNLRDQKSGRTALFHAAENHNLPIVTLLLHYNADTKIRNFFGTSVHDAMFELDEMPHEIKYHILGRDLKMNNRKKNDPVEKNYNPKNKKRKLEVIPTFQKINSKVLANVK